MTVPSTENLGAGDAYRPFQTTTTVSSSDGPCPVQIIEAVEDDHSFELKTEELAEILLDSKIADKNVAVVSVAGAFRKGKSFLLNFFLRYLQHWHETGTSPEDWLGGEDFALSGFSWRGGCERETNGLLIWSQPFITKLSNGEEVAVLLMDTQGAFDSQSTVKDCATVFALSTMISSVQIYNLSQNVQEDDLQHLQLFTEYGRLALDELIESKPFQSLLFLVRDWSFPYEAEYGFLGGQRILDRRLQVSDRQHPELQQLREHIRSCFDNIQCFLMPHPGLRVATNPQFKGQLGDIEDEFKQQLRCLIPRILSSGNLVLKEVDGKKITCRELLQYFRAYIKIFQGEELPEPKSMLLATAEANNLAAVANAKAHYCKEMELVCGGDTPYMAPVELEDTHMKSREEALTFFKQTRKMGGVDFSLSFLEHLDHELNESYDNYIKVNNGKNLFHSMRTPAVLFTILLLDYVLQEIFQFVGLRALETTCSTLLLLILMTICLWAYSRYSGNFREAGLAIDDLSMFVWTNVLAPLSYEGVNRAVALHRNLSERPLMGARNMSRKRTPTPGPVYKSNRLSIAKEE